MNENSNIKTNLGGPSIILVILVLSLTVFALLAVRSSLNEKKLADNTANSVSNYYSMNAKAEEFYAELQSKLDTGEDTDWYADAPEGVTVTAVEMTGSQVSSVAYEVASELYDNMRLSVVLIRNDEDLLEVAEWRTITEEPEDGYELELSD